MGEGYRTGPRHSGNRGINYLLGRGQPLLTKEYKMAKDFSLKKYKITNAFGPYKKGEIVAFHGMDAEAYAKNLSPVVTDEKKVQKISKK